MKHVLENELHDCKLSYMYEKLLWALFELET